MKRKYAAVGAGARISMFIDPLVDRFRDEAELVGLCDTSEARLKYHQERLSREYGITAVPIFSDFDAMLKAQKPNVVIVCTPDYLHHEFIVKSLEAGADVISEKPLTIDAQKCRFIMDAVARTGRKVRTTFNMRWMPGIAKVKELISGGSIGRIQHVNFEYFLNTSHGADYFRRWHSQKKYSGGLLLHKSTHHFDVVNWWLDGIPATVYAMGDLRFYGKKNAIERGDAKLASYDRYTGHAEAVGDPFALDLNADPFLRELYYEAELDNGYIRDRNVFRDGIDIEDSVSVLVKYRHGAMLAYSLNAFSPREGFRAAICGDRGRIDYEQHYASHVLKEGKEVPFEAESQPSLRLQKLFSEANHIAIDKLEGGHGGGDPLIQEQMFSINPPPDLLNRNAGHEQGAASLLIGAAANQSIVTDRSVAIDDLLQLHPEATRLSQLI